MQMTQKELQRRRGEPVAEETPAPETAQEEREEPEIRGTNVPDARKAAGTGYEPDQEPLVSTSRTPNTEHQTRPKATRTRE